MTLHGIYHDTVSHDICTYVYSPDRQHFLKSTLYPFLEFLDVHLVFWNLIQQPNIYIIYHFVIKLLSK